MLEMQVFNETEANNLNIIKGIPCLVGIAKLTVTLVGIDDRVAGRGFHEGQLSLGGFYVRHHFLPEVESAGAVAATSVEKGRALRGWLIRSRLKRVVAQRSLVAN
ncbi:ATP synthase subunit delta [Pyrus ussuriensis x Pyrus communis]|uniref:ATP synthase subunit delta n=1 Tax=Pyrus ussuriensis x Pyrus communis TaxID=2448454 RepID=A0A5N5EWY0_9ROSA|nr:ATP synthase subunit delta [Pyrus ussuriensis x Pyrus communis]